MSHDEDEEYRRGYEAGLRAKGGLYASGTRAWMRGFLDGVKERDRRRLQAEEGHQHAVPKNVSID